MNFASECDILAQDGIHHATCILDSEGSKSCRKVEYQSLCVRKPE